jgi:large subunit ribosomal protein L5
MATLRETYTSDVVPALTKEFGYKSVYAVPKIKKIVVNTGIAQPQDPRQRRQVIDNVVEQLRLITGQQPQVTSARKSIAGFKLRQGDPLGVMVTLRGKYMWEFLEKIIAVALPRVKDFRGVSRKAFDGRGNYSLGIEEQIIFPEIDYDKIEGIRSLQVTLVTSAETDEESRRMLELLGMPFEKENN